MALTAALAIATELALLVPVVQSSTLKATGSAAGEVFLLTSTE